MREPRAVAFFRAPPRADTGRSSSLIVYRHRHRRCLWQHRRLSRRLSKRHHSRRLSKRHHSLA